MTDDTLLVSENKRSFFIMLPILVDDMSLSVFAFRLYAHIVRRVGNGGECWENSRNMGEACNMSPASISRAKQELTKAKLIQVESVERAHGEFPYHKITIRDIWEENVKKYSTCSPQKQDHNADRNGTCSPDALKVNPILSSDHVSSKKASSSDARTPTSAKSALVGSLSASPDKSHPAIQAIKTVTGYYPPKQLYKRIKNLLGESPDTTRMKEVFDSWVANGYNPRNYRGWLFEWYKEGMYYVDPGKKLDEEQE
jgi:hypothetical protein